MAKTVGVGKQDFEKLRQADCFYVDKTYFIKEWWENSDDVTLITRPRRFGKTLNMSMVEQFFSLKYANRGELFEGLAIWQEDKYRKLQGTYPVISLTFANVKETDYMTARTKICQIISDVYSDCGYLLDSGVLDEKEQLFFRSVSSGMGDVEATLSLHNLSKYLSRYYGKKVIILLDKYDTPMQEAYVDGFWDELTSFTRSLFNVTFKTNPYLERAIMTGITRISKESIFSDLNNLEIVTTTSDKYETAFGFTQQEVFAALEDFGLSEKKQSVKEWYDGFTFGRVRDIYNPWSIINYLDKRRFTAYWVNTSSNSLVGKLIRQGTPELKMDFELLLQGGRLHVALDEQIVFSQLPRRKNAVWSLLLASGYLKVDEYRQEEQSGKEYYELSLTNKEVRIMFDDMVADWFAESEREYNGFIRALLSGDLKAMNIYMNQVAMTTFSYFDTGKRASEYLEPERFYHGFVLGLLVELSDHYIVTSNRESGFGRYDVMLEPRDKTKDAMILEFKVRDPEGEDTLQDTVESALEQIDHKAYAAELAARGIPEEHIRKYGLAFEGKKVLIGSC